MKQPTMLSSEELNDVIRRMWPTHNLRSIARALGLSSNVVSGRAMRMGLPKKRRGKPSGWVCPPTGEVRPLGDMELAPGHFAVDDYTYQAIKGLMMGIGET